ncbi:membrane protein [Streptomyces lavendofoliae]|uniref:Membrane protein n=1 Tax=Streptomyces lavendofoliae TaxID=67314 RepID=A0A918I3E9_9ACTN|nr:membrane protein [Streptomyces lavendofoliae]
MTPRQLLPALAVLLTWMVLGVLSAPAASQLGTAQVNSEEVFLADRSEAKRAQRLVDRMTGGATLPLVIVYERDGGLTTADHATAAKHLRTFASLPTVGRPVTAPVPSTDGEAIQTVLPTSADHYQDVRRLVERVRAEIDTVAGPSAHVTGPAGLLADHLQAHDEFEARLLAVTAAVVLLTLLLVYRSPCLWVLPAVSVAVAYLVAAGVVYHLAGAGSLDLTGPGQAVFTVLIFGAATDYALLLVSRCREELRRTGSDTQAVTQALRRTAPTLVASAATVVLGLLCLLLAGTPSVRAVGPVAAIGVIIALVVMTTLLPALLVLAGRTVFWPYVPGPDDPRDPHRSWTAIAELVARRPRLSWLIPGIVLLIAAMALPALRPDGIPKFDAFTTVSAAAVGQKTIERHYAAGSTAPVVIVAKSSRLGDVARQARGVPGVVAVEEAPAAATARDGTTGSWRMAKAVLASRPDSPQAQRDVERLRAAVHKVPGADALVGGNTAMELDTRTTAEADREVLLPAVLAAVSAVLVFLLRSLTAPLLVISTVVLSYVATLGACGLIFRFLLKAPHSETDFPLVTFVLLVALGADYNIFLMSRIREEARLVGTRHAIRRAHAATGGVITSAGMILAATFSALLVFPLTSLMQLGVAVAIGVLLDTLVVRSLLLPAVSHEIQGALWWPGRPPTGPPAYPERPRSEVAVTG